MSDVTTAPVETVKRKTQVSATLSPELFDQLEDYRWSNRINKTSDIVAEAVAFFLKSRPAEKQGK